MWSCGRERLCGMSDAEPEIRRDEPCDLELLTEPLDDERTEGAGRRFLVLLYPAVVPLYGLMRLSYVVSEGRDREETGVKQRSDELRTSNLGILGTGGIVYSDTMLPSIGDRELDVRLVGCRCEKWYVGAQQQGS